MKIKNGLIIKEINNEFILVDSGIVPPMFNGMIKLNNTSKYIVELLEQRELGIEELYQSLIEKYDVDKKTLENVVPPFLDELKRIKLLNE